MGSSDPELRMRQLAELRAAYDACPDLPDDDTGASTARHSRVLLGQILIALSVAPGSGCGRPIPSNGKTRADA